MDEKGKVLRGCRAMWLTFDNETLENTTCLGKDLDDLSIDLNPNVEQKKNVLGETITEHNGYTPSMANEYIARKEDAIYKHIQYIADHLAEDDEHISATMIVATLDIEVKDTGESTGTGSGYKVPVKVVVDSDGGGTSGYALPFTIYEDGARVEGTVTVTNKKPTFKATSTMAAQASTQIKTNIKGATESSTQ